MTAAAAWRKRITGSAEVAPTDLLFLARPIGLPVFDLGVVERPTRELETAVLVLRVGHRLVRNCTIEDHLAAMARQAEIDAHAQADILGEVISAVLDELELSIPARAQANELMAAELLKAAARWDAREPQWPA